MFAFKHNAGSFGTPRTLVSDAQTSGGPISLHTAIEAGRVVIMDNLPAHKPARVMELIEERGCELIYLPAYSWDLNPIEEAFSKIKGILRRAGARTKEALLEVLSEALSAVSSRDARGYFEHAGYRPQVQLL